MAVKQNRLQKNAGQFILDHPFASWAVWILAYFFVNSGMVAALDLHAKSRMGILAWITLGEMLLVPATFAYLVSQRQKATPQAFVLLSWVLAAAPILFAYVSLFDRAPQWLGAPALLESILVMAISRRLACRDQSRLAEAGRV